MKTRLPFLFLFCLIFIPLKSQNPGDLVTSEAVSETQDVTVEVMEFPEDKLISSISASLSRKGKALDQINDDNSIYVVASSTTTRPSNMPGFIFSRNVAYSIAELTAKMNLLRMAGEQITSGRGFEMIEDQVIGEDPDQQKKAGMLKKAMMVADKSLDKALNYLGMSDEEIQNLNQSKKKAVYEQKYNETIRSLVSGMVKGCSVVRICEGEVGNNDYQVSICMKYSPEFQALSSIIKKQKVVPSNPSKVKDSKEKVMNMPADELVGRMGTYTTFDPKGDMVIYGFGQQEVQGTGTRATAAFSRAYSKARLNAVNNIKNFVAEDLIAEESMQNTEKFSQYADGTENYFSQQKWTQAVQSNATTLNLPTTIVRRWKGIHPVSKQNIAGVVVMWSPTLAQQADQLKEEFKEDVPQGSSSAQPQQQKTQKSDYTITGDDEDL